MKTLKTIMMALSLAAIPFAVQAQQAIPAPAPAAAAAPAATTAPAGPAFVHRAPEADIGQPIPGGYKIQPQVTEIGEDAQWFHNVLLVPLITIISVFVLLLLAWASFRYRAKANPVPSKTSHNTFIEIIWTLVPVL